MSRIKSFFIAIATAFIAITPSIALAETVPAAPVENPTLADPLNLNTDAPIEDLVSRVIKAFLGIVGIIALVLFLYGGILWLTSAGNASKVEEGRNVFVWAVIGLVVIFSSYVIVNFVIDRLTTTG